MSTTPNRLGASQRRRFLSITLHAPGSSPIEGRVEDLSGYGARAFFPRSDTPRLEEQSEVELEFHALVLLKPLRLPARVRRLDEEGEEHEIAFEFIDPDAVTREVPFVLLREFSRRTSPRLMVEATVELALERKGRTTEALAVLVDVSSGGAGLRMNPGHGKVLRNGDSVDVRFSLPENEREFNLTALVRDLRIEPDELLVSVEFDASNTADFDEQQAEIQEYVNRCQAGTRSVPGR